MGQPLMPEQAPYSSIPVAPNLLHYFVPIPLEQTDDAPATIKGSVTLSGAKTANWMTEVLSAKPAQPLNTSPKQLKTRTATHLPATSL